MSTTTPNLGLIKPQLTDAADITAMNQNWDILDTTMVAKAVITSENPVSANTLFENGFYRCYFDNPSVPPEKYDFPCKYGSFWILGSSSYKAQLCLDVLNNVYYFRTTSNASTWKAWKRIITDAEQGTKGKFLGFTEDNKIGSLDLPSTKDYMFRELITEDNPKASESLKDVGTYQIYLANIDPTTYNYPNKYGLLMVERGTSYFKQTFYDMVGKVIYYRSSVDTGTTWTEWRKIYDTANKPTASEVGATSRTLLWERKSTGQFSATSVNISTIFDYDGIEIVFEANPYDGDYKSSGFIPCKAGNFFTLESVVMEGTASWQSRRGFISSSDTSATTGVHFYNGKQCSISSTTPTESALACIPYQIYGIK